MQAEMDLVQQSEQFVNEVVAQGHLTQDQLVQAGKIKELLESLARVG